MKIIFVGIHNKPGLTPLDSSTFTGKIIDQIIESLEDYGMNVVSDVIKSNFYDTDHLPTPDRWDNLRWATRVGYKGDDIVVRLGKTCQQRMHSVPILSIDLDHPSSLVFKNEDERYGYIWQSVGLIKEMVWNVSSEVIS